MMNVARTAAPLSWMIVFLLGTTSHSATEVEYISQEKRGQLEAQFESGHFSRATDSKRILGHSWTCDMYGVRTRLQVQHNIKLYHWAAGESSVWRNQGAQLIAEYQPQDERLVGVKDRFEDQIKLTDSGKLISRLRLTSAEKTVLAYSVCQAD